jgi:hypothetical protein
MDRWVSYPYWLVGHHHRLPKVVARILCARMLGMWLDFISPHFAVRCVFGGYVKELEDNGSCLVRRRLWN